ncbi:amidohydrolase family protein [Pigmentiphaga soli]|uniref:Amidohydrolase family protein n=1 Tax=Pigmentiphaga soli TaxID=1007095 RepID=A0ABP8GP81_9BURK
MKAAARPAGGDPAESPPQGLPPAAHPRRPRHALPPGATDCHCHLYEDPQRHPLNGARSYTPAVATLRQYLAMCAAVGLERTVQVSASVYGFDNSVTLGAIAALGQQRARGVAGLPPDAPAAELERLHAAGIRGVRLSTSVKGYGGTDAIGAMAGRIRPFGWHLQVHVRGTQELAALEDQLLRTQVPLVFDHMGCVRGGEGVAHPGFQALLRILQRRDDCWAKISSWYRRSDSGGPDHADMRPLVQALVAARPERLLFGTNWPHPRLFDAARMPDDGALVDQFCDWVPDAAVRRRILVDNPSTLYFSN